MADPEIHSVRYLSSSTRLRQDVPYRLASLTDPDDMEDSIRSFFRSFEATGTNILHLTSAHRSESRSIRTTTPESRNLGCENAVPWEERKASKDLIPAGQLREDTQIDGLALSTTPNQLSASEQHDDCHYRYACRPGPPCLCLTTIRALPSAIPTPILQHHSDRNLSIPQVRREVARSFH